MVAKAELSKETSKKLNAVELPTPDTLHNWRLMWRNTTFDAFSTTPNSQAFILLACRSLATLLPSTPYKSELRAHLLGLAKATRDEFEGDTAFMQSLNDVGLSRTEFLKGNALTDIVSHGEHMISSQLRTELKMASPPQPGARATLLLVDGEGAEIHFSGRKKNVSVWGDSDQSLRVGNEASRLLAMTGRYLSSDFLVRCVFLERWRAGTAITTSHPTTGKSIFIGTGTHISIRGEEYDLAEVLRALLHEKAHSEQRAMSRTGKEIRANEAEASGLHAVNQLAHFGSGDYDPDRLRSHLETLQLYARELKQERLSFLSSTSPDIAISADHNIKEETKRNDDLAKRIIAGRTPVVDLWTQHLQRRD